MRIKLKPRPVKHPNRSTTNVTANQRKQGKTHERDVVRGLRKFQAKHQDCFMFARLPDVGDYLKRKLGRGMLQFPTQPGDYMACYNGKHYFLECKSTKNPTSWSMKYITEKQLELLYEWFKAGDEAWVILANRNKVKHFTCYAINIELLYELYQRANKKDNRKWSIKWSELVLMSVDDPLGLLVPKDSIHHRSYHDKVIELTRGHNCWLFDELFERD